MDRKNEFDLDPNLGQVYTPTSSEVDTSASYTPSSPDDTIHASPVAPHTQRNGFMDFAYNGVWGGAVRAVYDTFNTINDFASTVEYNTGKVLDQTFGVSWKSPTIYADGSVKMLDYKDTYAEEMRQRAMTVEFQHKFSPKEADGWGGKIASGVTEFAALFLGASKVLKGTQLIAPTARIAGSIASSAAAAYTMDPMQGNLMNLADNLGVEKSDLAQYLHVDSLVNALKVNPDDDNFVARLKNTATDATIGLAAEGLIHGIKPALEQLGGMAKGVKSLSVAKKAAEVAVEADGIKLDTDFIAKDVGDHVASRVEPEVAQKTLAEDAGLQSEKLVMPEATPETVAANVSKIGAKLTDEEVAAIAKDMAEGKLFEPLDRIGAS